MKQGIHLVSDVEELARLRQLTIGQSDFQVDPAALAVDSKDERSMNLGFYEQGKLVAAMRFYPVFDRDELERQLDFQNAQQVPVQFPGVVVGKAGSLPEARGKGHIRALLLHGLKFYQTLDMKFAALTTKPSNRLNDYIEGLGFTKCRNPAGWHRFGYNSGGETFVFLKSFDLKLLCGS